MEWIATSLAESETDRSPEPTVTPFCTATFTSFKRHFNIFERKIKLFGDAEFALVEHKQKGQSNVAASELADVLG